MASLPTAAFREWSVIDDIGMRSTEGALEGVSEAIVAPSQCLRRFIELVPGDSGRHYANEVAIHPATEDGVFFKCHRQETGTWRRGSWDCTDMCVTLSFASRPDVAARTRSYNRNSYGCFAIVDHTTAQHRKFLLPQNL